MVDKYTSLDQWEAAAKERLGEEYEIPTKCEASKDSILMFCDAAGDNNPLYIDEEYARKSRFGEITAPLMFLDKVRNCNIGHAPLGLGIPYLPFEGISAPLAVVNFETAHPIYVGDRFTVRTKISDIYRKQTKSRGMGVWVEMEAHYFNQRKELVGTIWMTEPMFVSPPGPEVGELPIIFDEDDPENPDRLALERTRRGAEPRYWEDVEVGEQLTPLRKGLSTVSEAARWRMYCHIGPRMLLLYRETTNGMAVASIGGGNGGPGQQRTAWLSQLVTDWIGDDGTLKKLWSQMRVPYRLGDINVCKGKVTKKYIEAGEHLLDCDIWVESQRGVSTPGRATVALPSKKKV